MPNIPGKSSPNIAAGNPTARSRVTNGRQLLPDLDGRSVWARRLRDLINLHIDDLGGGDNTSEAERSIIRRAAVLEVELEYQETRFAELHLSGEEASDKRLDLYSRLAGNLRRLLESVGLQRRARDTTPDLHTYLRQRA